MVMRVFFFGGYKASPKDIDAWTGTAAAQRSDATFEGFPWPPSAVHSDDVHAIRAAKADGTIDRAVKLISAIKDELIFIVGHSSGCAIANAVDERLGNTGYVNLISLDGFRPSKAQQGRASTQMWSARNGKHTSLNYAKNELGGRLKVWDAQSCTNVWSLHFSMVNTATSDTTVKSNKDIANGYKGCRANLCWLVVNPWL